MDHSRNHHSTCCTFPIIHHIRKGIFVAVYRLRQHNYNTTKQPHIENLLCMSFEHPDRHLAADIKQPYSRVLTSRHKQLTVGTEPPTVCGVLKTCKCLHWFLGEWPINVDLWKNE